jgi:hypothetical protein
MLKNYFLAHPHYFLLAYIIPEQAIQLKNSFSEFFMGVYLSFIQVCNQELMGEFRYKSEIKEAKLA